MFFKDFLSRIMWSWKRGYHAKWGIVFRAWVETADLNPRIMDAKFFDCIPNLFFGVLGAEGNKICPIVGIIPTLSTCRLDAIFSSKFLGALVRNYIPVYKSMEVF